MHYVKTLLSIEDLVKYEGPVWVERLDYPYTDMQGWVRIQPKFTSDVCVGFRFLKGITSFGVKDYGTAWKAYSVQFDPTKGIPVLYFGTVVSLEELSAASDVSPWEIKALKKLIFS